MAFRLAERLGLTVAELLCRISSRELSEWIAYDRIHTAESWHQTAQICHTITCVLWSGKGRPPKYEDFLPRKPKGPVQPMTPEEMRAAMGRFRSN